MKRIVRIELENSKAYFGNYVINNPKGHNLLIYGENGSGKSSLYKSLDLFLKNSLKDQKFSKNIFNDSAVGNIIVEFADYNGVDADISNSEVYRFSSVISNNKIPFLQEASLIKGFLDYTDLLRIYLKSSRNPNLFDLVIENLLKDFVPLSSGSTISIGSNFNNIKNDLLKRSFNRNARIHKFAKEKLVIFEAELRHTLDQIFLKVNELLSTYFTYNDFNISYILDPLTMNYGSSGIINWKINTGLYLNLKKGDLDLGTEYKEILNEARLSSIAICIYLSSLILYPKDLELKLLYLDDIFVGLDSSNRLPILEIIKDHFSNFQVVISTYDKSFFNIAKLKLNTEKWISFEFYTGKKDIDGTEIEVPIITESKNDFERAKYHLYNSFPDYPASANYLRKTIESLINNFFPKFLFKDDFYLDIPSYKLSRTFGLVQNFLQNAKLNISEINNLKDYLYILLHPLSHYQIDASEYKNDLINIEILIDKLYRNLPPLLLQDNYVCVLEKGGLLKIELFTDVNNKHVYEFSTSEHLISNIAKDELIGCKLHCTTAYNLNVAGTKSNLYKPNNNDLFKYDSLNDAYDKICNYLLQTEEPQLVKGINGKNRFKMLRSDIWEIV